MGAAETSSKGCLRPSRTAFKLSNAAAKPWPWSPCCLWMDLSGGMQHLLPCLWGITWNSAPRQNSIGSRSHLSHRNPRKLSCPLLSSLTVRDEWVGKLHQWGPRKAACCKDSLVRIPLREPQQVKPKLEEGNQTVAKYVWEDVGGILNPWNSPEG